MDDQLKKEVMAGSTNMAEGLQRHRELMGLQELTPWPKPSFSSRHQMFSNHGLTDEKINPQPAGDESDDDRQPCSS